jgi:hypothetical protein
MKSIEDKLDRRIREQRLVCLINEALLGHYEEQKTILGGTVVKHPSKRQTKGVQDDQDQDPRHRPPITGVF